MSLPRRSVAGDVRGAVYVEFLIVFMPVWILFLGVLQLGFTYAARLVVQHAAVTATRAAIVVLDDDPARYEGEARNRVDPGGSSGTPSPVAAAITGLGVGGGAPTGRGSPRFRDIHAAASIALFAAAPSSAQLEEDDNIENAIGRGQSRTAAAASYNDAALAISFPTEPGADTTRTSFEPDELVTVRVAYVFHCALPAVPALMCDTPGEIAAKLSADEAAQLDLGTLSQVQHPRYLLLRGEATLPNQSAGYRYPSE